MSEETKPTDDGHPAQSLADMMRQLQRPVPAEETSASREDRRAGYDHALVDVNGQALFTTIALGSTRPVVLAHSVEHQIGVVRTPGRTSYVDRQVGRKYSAAQLSICRMRDTGRRSRDGERIAHIGLLRPILRQGLFQLQGYPGVTGQGLAFEHKVSSESQTVYPPSTDGTATLRAVSADSGLALVHYIARHAPGGRREQWQLRELARVQVTTEDLWRIELEPGPALLSWGTQDRWRSLG